VRDIFGGVGAACRSRGLRGARRFARPEAWSNPAGTAVRATAYGGGTPRDRAVRDRDASEGALRLGRRGDPETG